MSVRWLLASVAALAFGQGAAAEDDLKTKTPAPTTIAADVKVGDRWDYSYHSDLDGHTNGTESFVVQDVSAGRIETELRTHRPTGDRDTIIVQVFDPHWRFIEGPKGKYVSADTTSAPFPSISIGKEWTSEVYWQPTYSSLRFKWTEHGHVAAWESVKLADGKTYDAFKIVYRRESTPVQGTGIQVVQAGMTTHKIVDRSVEWYAPAVNRYVKRTYETSSDGTIGQSFSEELTSYKRGD